MAILGTGMGRPRSQKPHGSTPLTTGYAKSAYGPPAGNEYSVEKTIKQLAEDRENAQNLK